MVLDYDSPQGRYGLYDPIPKGTDIIRFISDKYMKALNQEDNKGFPMLNTRRSFIREVKNRFSDQFRLGLLTRQQVIDQMGPIELLFQTVKSS